MSYLLGIDVGTTRTAAAIARPGELEIVDLGERASTVPSVLHIGTDGAVAIGDAAERRATSDPGHVVREFKRRIGDPTPIVVAGRSWAPEELSALLVRWVVDRVAEREGGAADRIAVTHPASWGHHKKDLLSDALTRQGLTVVFLPEPQTAAMHYAATERVEQGSTIAVYDLGGGTFDAALVRKGAARSDSGSDFELLGRSEGLERLSGIDFDALVFEHVRSGLPEAFEDLDETDPAVLSAVAAVRRECTEAKEALSSDNEVSIPVLTPSGQGSVRLHRSEFEAMIRPHVEETVDVLRRAIASAALTPEQLTAVLLVGGSSRIPLVAQLVGEQLGRPVAVDVDPKDAIAKGAARSLMPATPAPAPSPVPVGPVIPAPRDGTPDRYPTGAPQVGPAAYDRSRSGGQRAWAGASGAFVGVSDTGPIPARAEPPTQRVAAGAGLPWQSSGGTRPAGAYRSRGDGYERTAGRSPAALVIAGALATAAAVVAGVVVWSGVSLSSPGPAPEARVTVAVTPPGSPAPTTTDVTATPAVPVPTRAPVAPVTRPPRTTPPPTTTPPPPTTTVPPPTTTVPPTTIPPTTEPPPPVPPA